MTSHFTRTMIACLIALPSVVYSADITSGAQPAIPQPAPVSAPAAEAAAPAPVQTARIGYVDIARIGVESERGKALKALLTAKKDSLQAKIDGKKKQLEKLKSSIEAKAALMTPPQREAKSKEFQKKLEEFQKSAQESEKEFYTLQEKETGALYQAIERAALAHGVAAGFAVIVVKKELLYIGSSVDAQDVTDVLIKALDLADQKK